METFGFSEERKAVGTIFNGPLFYNVYKDADFLRVDANVENLLSRGYELRHKLKTVPIGHSIVVEGMKLGRKQMSRLYETTAMFKSVTNFRVLGYYQMKIIQQISIHLNLPCTSIVSDTHSNYCTPLILKRGGIGVTVEDFEFTYNRLQGLVAAFTYENRHRFPVLEASEPKALGLVWDNENEEKCKLYLSAISGTDNMIDQFSFFPLLCALRKFQLKKMPVELVLGTASVKNDEGITMPQLLCRNLITAKRMWLMFPGSSVRDIETVINTTPKIQKLFQG